MLLLFYSVAGGGIHELLPVGEDTGQVSMDPYLDFSVFGNENHVLADPEDPEVVPKHAKALEADPHHVHGIGEGDVIDVRQPHFDLVEVDAGRVGAGAQFGS